MDDKDFFGIFVYNVYIAVQIPLWTIRTVLKSCEVSKTIRSDSSMDDKDYELTNKFPFSIPVQIPLWTIRTGKENENQRNGKVFRFLYGR